MNIIKNDTPKPLLFLLMWLLETGQMKLNLQMQLEDDALKGDDYTVHFGNYFVLLSMITIYLLNKFL